MMYRSMRGEIDMAVVASTPPEQGQLVTVRQRRYVVTEVANSNPWERLLRAEDNGAQHLIMFSSVEDDAFGEELQVIWELKPKRSADHPVPETTPSGR